MKTNFGLNMAQTPIRQGISAQNISRIQRGFVSVVPLVGFEMGAGKVAPDLVKGQMRGFEHAPRDGKTFKIAEEIFHTANELKKEASSGSVRVSGGLSQEELKEISEQKISTVMRVAVEIGSGKINPATALGQLKGHSQDNRHNATAFALKAALESIVNPSQTRQSKAFSKAFAASETTTMPPIEKQHKPGGAFTAIFAPKKRPEPQKAPTPVAAFVAAFKA